LDADFITAQSGPEALLKIANQEIALALLDVQMVEMDGLELSTIIRNDKSREVIPIIFITGQASGEIELEKYYESGAVDYIAKPVRRNILISKVKIFLELYRQKVIIRQDHIALENSANELTRINQTLKESNEFNSHLLRTIPYGMDIVDEHGTFLFLSDSLKEMVGCDAIGQRCWNYVQDTHCQCEGCPLSKGITIGSTEVHEVRGVFGGRTFQISHTGMMFKGKKALLEIYHDITEQIQSKNALIESERMYRTLLNASPEGILILDMNGIVTEISDITHEIFGTKIKNKFVGLHFSTFVPPEELEKFTDVLKKTLVEGLVQNVEVFITKENSSRLICELSTTLIQE
jgi:PAS domain S-box-containing protein